jgi:hypothetical protein
MADLFLSLPLEERREILESAFGRGLTRSTALLEKDVWVVWTLQALFTAPFADALVFKGGTSLSKAYNVIRRFSEDVDLTYDIRKLVDDEAGQPERLSDAEAKSVGRRIRERLLPQVLKTKIQPYLEAKIDEAGLPATVEREGENLFVIYEAAADYAAIDYYAAVGGNLVLVPLGQAFVLLKSDYDAMIEAGYLEGDAEPFETLMNRCTELQHRINRAV